MAVEREQYDGPITFVCDDCGEIDATGCTQWAGAMAKFRSHGGRAVKVGDDWEHRCRECAE